MKRVQLVGVLLSLVLSLAACRPRPAPGPATVGPASPTAAPAPAVPAPTPTPALPGLGDPVPADVEPISSQNLSRLQPIWRAEWPMWRNLWATREALIAVSISGLMVMSPSDLETVRFVPLPAHTEFPGVMAVQPDHRVAVVGTGDGVLYRVDWAAGEIRGEARISATVEAMAFIDPEGRRVAVLADGLRIWEPDGSVSSPVGALPQKDYEGQLSSDGHWALTVDDQGRGGLYEVPSGTQALSFTAPFTNPNAIVLHPNARYAAIAGEDAVVILRVDPSQGRVEELRRFSQPDVRAMGAGPSLLAILSEEGGGTRLRILRWESGESVMNTLLDLPFSMVHLDEEGGRVYLSALNRMEVRSLSDGRVLGQRQHPTTLYGVPVWEQRAIVLGPELLVGTPDVALLDLSTGRIRWHRVLKPPARSMWLDPQGRWLAVALRGGSVEFLNLQTGESIGRLELQGVDWIGVDAQGRGLIGIQSNTVALWPAQGASPIWQRALPVPKDLKLIGAVSSQWIAIAPDFGDKYQSIWILDHEGKVQATLRGQEEFGRIYKLEWSSDHLVAHLSAGSSKWRVFILSVPQGYRVADPRILSPYSLTEVHWWPDLRVGVINNLLDNLEIFGFSQKNLVIRTLQRAEDIRFVGLQRMPQSALLLTGAQEVRVKRRVGGVRWWLKRGGWLQAFDLSQEQKIWERPVPFSVSWVKLSPDGRWIILGGVDGHVEVWGVR
jgi:WD40 repeat protein